MTQILRSLRERFRNRPDTEHEQAQIRLAVGVILFFYLLPASVTHTAEELQADHLYFGAMVAFLSLALAIFVSILFRPGASPARRIFGAMLDSGAATFFLVAADFHAMPLFQSVLNKN